MDPGRSRDGGWTGALVVVWIFNLWGAADLLYAFYLGLFGVGVEPGLLGAAFFVPTLIVPLLLITHGFVFRLLLVSPHPDGVGGGQSGGRPA